MAVSVLIACTKDYGSDIKALQDKVDNLNTEVGRLQKLITDGSVITSVTPVEGGVKVTLSNGDPFVITNGKDGKDGTVWSIGDNGNWFCDGIDSEKPARGPQGDTGASAYEVAKANGFTGTEAEWLASLKGKDGVDGDSAYEVAKKNGFTGTEAEWLASLKGAKGDKGDAGDYYLPCTDKSDTAHYGKWIKVNGATGEKTYLTEEWLPLGTITAIVEDGILELHNVEGAEDGIVEISLSKDIVDLAVIPEIWDPDLGMSQATVYAVTPTKWELYMFFRQYNEKIRNWLDQNNGANPYLDPAFANVRYWCMLYNSYLGITGQTSNPAYNAAWDCNSDSYVNYKWPDATQWGDVDHAIEEGEIVYDYATIANAVNSALDILGNCVAYGSNYAENYTFRQIPVSALRLKYRVSPAGADVANYKFSMLDRRLQVGDIATKAEGDHYNYAVAKVNVEKVGLDQLNVEGYVDYWKYFADKPIDWLIELMAMKSTLAWDYQWTAEVATIGTGKTLAQANYVAGDNGGQPISDILNMQYRDNGYFKTAYESMSAWVNANSISYETIVALEAAKNTAHAEAVVSDYTAVKLRYLYPLWTAYNRHEPGLQAARWRLAYNSQLFATYGPVFSYENDYLVEGTTYDVAARMRFADPYYGSLENLGFKVEYHYFTYDTSNSQQGGPWSAWGYHADGVDAQGNQNYDDNVSGEYIPEDFDGYDKVTCTDDGKVSIKEGAEDYIGRYVMICADATIVDQATGKKYGSVFGPTTGNEMNTNYNHLNANRFLWLDEFMGHYLLLIVPDTNKTLNVVYDLGDVDYLTLAQSWPTPAPLASLDPRPQEGRNHEWDDALEMDMTGFNNIYTADPVVTATPQKPGSYEVTFSRDKNKMFTIKLNNQVPLGADKITYTFTPKDDKYSKVCYTIKWNVVINWAETEPILNPDYILYDDDARTQLTKTIINPDPATLSLTGNDYVAGAWKDYRATSTDMTKVPYVDSIVAVKGKDVAGTWKPQTSIREHIKDYGQYMDIQQNVDNLAMSIDWANTKYSDGTPVPNTSAKIESVASGKPQYKLQEMSMLEAFKAYEQYRDYLVNIKVTLKNGAEKIVKAYIVRFINPFKLKVTDVVLHTHKQDWCAAPANIMILDVDDESKVIYDFATNTVDASYNTIYPGILTSLAEEANRPKFKLVTPIDPSFGTIETNGYETENLKVDVTSGWFYWRNLGTDLQVDKNTQYEVTLTIPGVAELADKGKVTVLSVANSKVFHKDHDDTYAAGTTPQPYDHARTIWEIIFE
ncbi:MAG: hypothetical protein J5693_06870 [Bacteroidales bacterium]|nr:hypothetical protein [Bacteroidales bacterium]